MDLPPLVALARPRQWYKNLIVLVPLLFSGNAASTDLWLPAGLAVAAFCLLSSATYAANDVADRKRDQLHPRKALRPVASGKISPAIAIAFALALAAGGLFILWELGPSAWAAGLAYLFIQAVYNAWLKHVMLWDALTVASGFVVRALAGTAAIQVGRPTEWLIVCTFLFAFYLALAKRRHELLLARDAPESLDHRPTLGAYTVAFLEQTMQVATALLLAAYSLYTFFGTSSSWMMFTLPFAFYGILRYNFLVHRRDIGDEAEMMFTDRAMLANALAWLTLVILILAGWPERAMAWLERL